MKHYLLPLTIASVLAITGVLSQAQAVENNLNFSGTLVSEPCDLDPSTTDITVDFKSVVEKYLYLNTRTNSVPFTINLINCDISIQNSVTFSFTGTEDSELPGLLNVTGTASGIAIGIEKNDGTPIPLNIATPAYQLANGSNTFSFQAYVEGEPKAIAEQSIIAGSFSSIATFEMNYL